VGGIVGLVGGLVVYYAISGFFERRFGSPWHSMTPWLTPSVAAPLAIVLPLALLLPAWGTSLAAGIVAIGLLLNDYLCVSDSATSGVQLWRAGRTTRS